MRSLTGRHTNLLRLSGLLWNHCTEVSGPPQWPTIGPESKTIQSSLLIAFNNEMFSKLYSFVKCFSSSFYFPISFNGETFIVMLKYCAQTQSK